jgi:hypothetical protein
MSIIDFRQDIRVDDYYRNLYPPKHINDHRSYMAYLYNIGDMKKIGDLKHERRLLRGNK